MTSVIPMKLVPINEMYGQGDNNNTLELPTLTTTSVAIDNNINKSDINSKIGDLSNLDKELLEILRNNDLTEDAKARLYWVSLHKAEIYKDKSMWTEPVIVELRENRFIPVPIRKNGNDRVAANVDQTLVTTTDDDVTFDRGAVGNVAPYSNKRKRVSDVIEDVIADSNKRMREEEDREASNLPIPPRQQIRRIPPKLSPPKPLQILPTPQRVATKRKLVPDEDSEEWESDKMLRKMAKINRIQSNLTQGEFEKNVKIGEPLVVFDTQDQSIPSTSTGPAYTNQSVQSHQSQPIMTASPADLDYIRYDELPQWMRRFFRKVESVPKLKLDIQEKIKNLLIEIHSKDPNFIIQNKSMLTSQNILTQTDPINILKNYVSGLRRSSRASEPFLNYLAKLGIADQIGSGFRKRIRKWVKL
jgi:hypothetical protein